jgi:biopolymer transport protein ExbB
VRRILPLLTKQILHNYISIKLTTNERYKLPQGNIIQQIAPVLFYIEITLYVLLVLAGIAGLGIFIFRLRAIYKAKGNPSKWINTLSQNLENGTLPKIDISKLDTSALPDRIVQTGIKNAGLAPEALEKVFEVQESMERRSLESGVSFLGTLGANAPFVGLSGTVLGVLIAFNEFARTGGQGNTEVMVAIARSLIATALGLLVAIPAVIAFNILRSRIKHLLHTSKEIRDLILARSVNAVSKEIGRNEIDDLLLAQTVRTVTKGI